MRFIQIGLLLVMLLNLTGCGSKVEMDEMTFIYALFVDSGKEPGTVTLTISTPLPNRLMSGQMSGSGSGDGKAYSTVTKTAPSITEGLRAIQKDLTRRLSISHIKVIVVGKDYAKRGIGDLFEWFKREPGFPLGTYVLASPGTAKEMTKLTPIFEQLPSQVLEDFAAEKYMLDTSVQDCLIADESDLGFALTYLSYGTKTKQNEQSQKEYWAGIQGAMLFEKNKMKAIVKTQEGQALAWALGGLRLPNYSLKLNDNHLKVGAIFVKTGSSKSVRLSGNKPVFTVKIKGKASIIYLDNPDNLDQVTLNRLIRNALQQKVDAEVSEAIQSTQKAGADILHLGLLLEWNHPRIWNQLRDRWTDYYTQHAKIDVVTDFNLVDFGSEK
ncbi:Ger(x)C family spore germination protein [Paenibacillus sp. sgz500958]|uniref:Ger(x)C family spore germination protein n=1 Tax=Paenibacillus sp. sgz500958 TaxID=3242475 RepID=UPI0036D3ADF7